MCRLRFKIFVEIQLRLDFIPLLNTEQCIAVFSANSAPARIVLEELSIYPYCIQFSSLLWFNFKNCKNISVPVNFGVDEAKIFLLVSCAHMRKVHFGFRSELFEWQKFAFYYILLNIGLLLFAVFVAILFCSRVLQTTDCAVPPSRFKIFVEI